MGKSKLALMIKLLFFPFLTFYYNYPYGRFYGNGKSSVDTVNTVEQIVVTSPITGTWKVL